MWLDTWYCLLQYVCYSYMCIFSKMKSRWKIKSRPQNSKDKAQIALEKTSFLQHLQTNSGTTKFDSLSLLHPIATSLNNSIDGLQFWNCSLNTGLSSVYWLHFGPGYLLMIVTNNKFGVMLVLCVHGLQVPAESLWYLMFTPHNFRAKEKGWKLWASTCRSTYTHQTETKPCYYYCLTKTCLDDLYIDVSDPFRVRPAGPPLAFTTNPTILAVCRQIVTNSLLWFQSLAVQVQV